MQVIIVLMTLVAAVKGEGATAAGPGAAPAPTGGLDGYKTPVRSYVKKEPYLVEQRVPYTVVKKVPVYKPVYNTVYKEVPQPYEVVKHVQIVKHVPIIKHVPVVKHHTVLKPVPVVKHHTHVQKIPVSVPIYVHDKPSYGGYGQGGGYGYSSH